MSANPPASTPGRSVAVPRNTSPAPAAAKPGADIAKSPFQSFRGTLERMKPQLLAALPSHIKPDRLIRIILTTVQRTPELLECTPESLLGSLLQCAQLGLEPDGVLGQAYLVPFRNWKNNNRKEVQLIPGYKGLIKLAYQSGEVGHITARVVRAKDKFQYWYGLNEGIEHEPHRGSDAGEMVACYAWAKIKGVEGKQFVVLERWEVDAIRERAKASDKGPWVTDYDEMAKKSALRRLCKMLPASVEKDNLARAVALDEHAEAHISQQISYQDMIDIDVEPVPLPTQSFAPDPGPAADGPETHQSAAEAGAAAGKSKPASLDDVAAQSRAAREALAATAGDPRAAAIAKARAAGRTTFDWAGKTEKVPPLPAGASPPELDKLHESMIGQGTPPADPSPPEPGSEG